MSLTRYVEPCDIVPKGWGAAYTPWNRLGGVIAPIPLNLLLGALYALCGWLRSAPIAWKSPRHRLLTKAFHRGYQRGEKAGRDKGYQDWSRFRDRKIAQAEARADAAIELATRMAACHPESP